jgi:hypothetical protein
MSVSINTHGALEQPTSVRLTSTSITDIYTATNPNGTTVVAITLANETAGAVIVKIDRYDGSTNFNTFRRSVAANATEILSDFPMKLRSGHKIRATADGANAITVNCAVVLDAAAARHSG